METMQLAGDMATIRQGRILFSHHSVGGNIISGIKLLDTGVAGGNLRFSSLHEATNLKGPTLIDISGGRNGEPKSKIDFFSATIRNEKNLKPDLAFMKLCYVDFTPRTDIDDLFGYYRNSIATLKREHPEIKFAHVTTPLTIQPRGLKHWIFRLIGREVWEDAANVKRAEFNRRIKESFVADPVFDLAHVEATAPDGSLSSFEENGQRYPNLYPGYTEDGGHLNTLGQQVAGTAAIRFIAESLKSRRATR